MASTDANDVGPGGPRVYKTARRRGAESAAAVLTGSSAAAPRPQEVPSASCATTTATALPATGAAVAVPHITSAAETSLTSTATTSAAVEASSTSTTMEAVADVLPSPPPTTTTTVGPLAVAIPTCFAASTVALPTTPATSPNAITSTTVTVTLAAARSPAGPHSALLKVGDDQPFIFTATATSSTVVAPDVATELGSLEPTTADERKRRASGDVWAGVVAPPTTTMTATMAAVSPITMTAAVAESTSLVMGVMAADVTTASMVTTASSPATVAMALPSCSAVPSTAAAVSLPASTTTVMASPTALTTVAGLSASPPCARAEADSVFVFTATAASSTAATPTDPASGAAVPNTSIAPVAESNERKRKAPDDDEVEAADRNNNVLKATVVLGDVSVVAPEPKRARLDVVDVLLDEALTLLLRSGAHLVQRTRRDGAAPELGAWPWTVRCPAPVGAAQKPLRYVRLPTSSIEYQALSDAFRATCRGKGLHVTRVCRVQNDRLLRLFQDQVLRLQKGCGEVAVVRVYHGTRRDSVESICEGNLDPLLAGRASSHTRWGKGVNFSPISYYSSHYCDQQATYRSMLVCDVAMSRVCSARDIEEAPPLPEDAGRVYDTNMKLRPAAQVLCKFAKHEFYPAYVVDYKAESCGDRSAYQESDYYHQPQSRAHWPWQ